MLRVLGLAVGLLQAGAYDTSEWKCFDEEPVVVKYADTGVPVALPKYKTLVGDWGSWILTNWIARILLKEKMGVDLEFWCTDDYTKYATCDLDYPVSTWDNVENGNIDMNLEAWVRAGSIANHAQRTYENRVIDMGPIGTTGMALLYTADYDGTWTVGNWKALKDPAIRNAVFTDMKPIFDKYRSYGWLKTYSTAWEEPGVYASGGKADMLATANTEITKPFILAVGFGWAHTRLIWDKINKHGLGQYWDLWVTDTEPHLSAIVDEAGSLQKRFVAQLFGPGYDMASFEKQRIAWPVPFKAGCSANATCEAELEPLFKVGNPRTMGKIPEVQVFIERLRIPGNVEMNGIMYDQLSNNIEWRQAACNWLKANTDDWTSFIIPIVRHEDKTPIWQTIVRVGAVVVAMIFLGYIIYIMWKCMSKDEDDKVGEEARIRQKYKREAKIELCVTSFKIVLDILDVGSTTYSTYTCFEVAGDHPVLITMFCCCLVIEVAYSAFVSKERMTMLQAAVAVLQGRLRRIDTGLNNPSVSAKDPKKRRFTVVHFQAEFKTASDRRYRQELLSLVAGLGEDLPSIILYSVVFVMGYREMVFVFGALISCIAFGYKMSSLEKMNIWRKKTPFRTRAMSVTDGADGASRKTSVPDSHNEEMLEFSRQSSQSVVDAQPGDAKPVVI